MQCPSHRCSQPHRCSQLRSECLHKHPALIPAGIALLLSCLMGNLCIKGSAGFSQSSRSFWQGNPTLRDCRHCQPQGLPNGNVECTPSTSCTSHPLTSAPGLLQVGKGLQDHQVQPPAGMELLEGVTAHGRALELEFGPFQPKAFEIPIPTPNQPEIPIPIPTQPI